MQSCVFVEIGRIAECPAAHATFQRFEAGVCAQVDLETVSEKDEYSKALTINTHFRE